jgi:hypothetical protein
MCGTDPPEARRGYGCLGMIAAGLLGPAFKKLRQCQIAPEIIFLALANVPSSIAVTISFLTSSWRSWQNYI